MNINMAFVSVGTVTKDRFWNAYVPEVQIMNLLYPRVNT